MVRLGCLVIAKAGVGGLSILTCQGEERAGG